MVCLTPYNCYVVSDPKPVTHNLPHSLAGVARNRIIREIRGSNPTLRGRGDLRPLYLMLSRWVFDRMSVLKPA